ncbi:hypothetical protein [Micromonospora sp. NPDC006431]|uniref:hypothetical protein n=1 Tax=Micromonospora sp. NPDC006431 TaxID=3364235 RepID=UPI0036BC27A8
MAASAMLVGNAQSASPMGGFSPTSPITATPINQNTQQIAPGVVQSDYSRIAVLPRAADRAT